MDPFSSLPEEIKLHIFSYLSQKDLSISASGVSKDFYRLSTDWPFWKVLHLCDHPNYLENSKPHTCIALQRILHRCTPSLIHLSFDCHCEKNLRLIEEFKNFPRLQSLYITTKHKLTESHFSKIYSKCKSLQEIRLLSEAHPIFLNSVWWLFSLPHLKRFSMKSRNCLGDAGDDFLILLSRISIYLEGLNVNYDFACDTMNDFCRLRGSQLRYLHLQGSSINNSNLKTISQECPNLEGLQLKFCSSVTHLDDLASLTRFKILIVKYMRSLSIRALETSLDKLKNLTTLHLDMASDAQVMKKIAGCRRLTNLIVYSANANFTDDYLRPIVESCSRLRFLDLDGETTDFSPNLISRMPSLLPQLAIVNLGEDRHFEILKKLKPDYQRYEPENTWFEYPLLPKEQTAQG